MTEEEAKEQLCPINGLFSALILLHSTTTNTVPPRETFTHMVLCTASDCMMWRWEKGIEQLENMMKDNPEGYCGLAGAP